MTQPHPLSSPFPSPLTSKCKTRHAYAGAQEVCIMIYPLTCCIISCETGRGGEGQTRQDGLSSPPLSLPPPLSLLSLGRYWLNSYCLRKHDKPPRPSPSLRAELGKLSSRLVSLQTRGLWADRHGGKGVGWGGEQERGFTAPLAFHAPLFFVVTCLARNPPPPSRLL